MLTEEGNWEGVDGGRELGYETVGETGSNVCVTSWKYSILLYMHNVRALLLLFFYFIVFPGIPS